MGKMSHVLPEKKLNERKVGKTNLIKKLNEKANEMIMIEIVMCS